MPILKDLKLPASAADLDMSCHPTSTLFIIFISSADPQTGAPWCPDVRASLPFVVEAFSGDDTPDLAIIEVGQKPEWKNPENFFRTNWNVHGIPSLIKYELVNGKVFEKGRITEDGILDASTLSKFIV